MASPTLTQRVALLETQLAQLQNSLHAADKSGKDWRRTIGMFTEDDEMKVIFQAALQLREADREKARSRSVAKSRKSRR